MTSKPTARPDVSEITGVKDPAKSAARSDSRKPVSMDTILQERLVQYDEIVGSSRELFEEKNAQYKDSISRTGVLGSVVAIAGLSARLENLVLAASDAGKSEQDAIVDVVKDLINYGVITGVMIMEDNWKP